MNYDGTFSKIEALLLCVCCLILGFTSMLLIKPQHISNEITPQDWVKEEDIFVYQNKVCFEANNLSWTAYKPTGSMRPLFDEGANGIETKPDNPEAIKVGDVISFKDGDTIIVHRVIKTAYDSTGWFAKTKGDNNPIEDSIKIRFKNINGVLIALIY